MPRPSLAKAPGAKDYRVFCATSRVTARCHLPGARAKPAYVSHSSTVRHSVQRARTRPRTGILMRW
ncbi:hypothetical protein SAV14893_058260 [Streptomyces avermitilis]|uniref:Uncharacterized protein n=1 Tax=Streptomyces avermitilis TaxID=33903 RepID=A0A4D4M3M0_STRAX|nr:hypothetical protein SAVMC3_70570 [Streptomyces avermitilis]GDY66433.1 hypothetical protein SAV14893_058260 [Streptomyces avermitilis]